MVPPGAPGRAQVVQEHAAHPDACGLRAMGAASPRPENMGGTKLPAARRSARDQGQH